jgi:hypothetical protein
MRHAERAEIDAILIAAELEPTGEEVQPLSA